MVFYPCFSEDEAILFLFSHGRAVDKCEYGEIFNGVGGKKIFGYSKGGLDKTVLD